MDLPYWTRLTIKGSIPPETVRLQFGTDVFSQKGSVWFDDISLMVDDVEGLKNRSFEEK